MFLLIGLGERAGSGIAKIQQGWTSLGCVFKIEDAHQPYNHTLTSLLWGITRSTTPKTTSKTTSKTTPKTAATHQALLAYLRKHPKATQSELTAALGNITQNGVKYHLKMLKAKKLIKRAGPTNGGIWVVLDEKNE